MKKQVISILIFVIILAIPGIVFASSQFPAYLTEANVNLRTQPNTDSEVIITVPRNAIVSVMDFRDYDWFFIEYEGHTGFMKAEFLTPQQAAPEPEPELEPVHILESKPEPFFIPESVYEPTPSYLPEPVQEYVMQFQSEPITSQGNESALFIHTQDIPLSAPAILREAYITIANVNLRSLPSTDSARIVTVYRGSKLYVTDFRDHDWFAVEYNGRPGYMKAEFLIEESKAASFGVTYADTSIGTVELLQWSDAKHVFKIGVPVQIIDVRSRITYMVRSFSNGLHADVETLTTQDTEALKRTFNNRWSWDTRPILVLVGDRVLAASINGMPHGGATISGNGMNGQVCIHFQGSRTHNGSRYHERDHQSSVMEAFNTASRW